MKKQRPILFGPLAALLALTCVCSLQAGPFSTGNIVVSRVGTPGGTLSGGTAARVFLDEYTPSGSLVQSVALPISSSGSSAALTVQGTSTTEGVVTRSENGNYLVVAGYAATPATTGLPGTSASVNRVVGRRCRGQRGHHHPPLRRVQRK